MTTRRSISRRAALPTGAWRRFFTALSVLVVVLVGVPVLLVVCSRAGLDAAHPFPSIGSTDEMRTYFERRLTPTEVAPVALRALLVVAWALWLAMVSSVCASILEARGSGRRSWVPQLAMFAGLGRWIAAGLTAVSSLAPNFVSAASLASPRPFTISAATPETVVAETPVPAGFARVAARRVDRDLCPAAARRCRSVAGAVGVEQGPAGRPRWRGLERPVEARRRLGPPPAT